ncbi:Uncharacterised protein [Mycobacteroides abscessus subsp. abscessus]|nr:Uncharacterised protein [Mycobacteroides abscessus subsp. abscessus]
MGPVSNATVSSMENVSSGEGASSAASERAATAHSTVISAATERCRWIGRSEVGVVSGTPADRNARRSAGNARWTDRTMTAMSDHGTPSNRWARRSRSAMAVASLAADENTLTAAPASPSAVADARG